MLNHNENFMKKNILKLSLLAVFVVPKVASAEVPLADFFRHAEFASASLSPDGKHLAITLPRDDRQQLGILRIADKKVVSTFDAGEKTYIANVRWVSNERFTFTKDYKSGKFDRPLPNGNLFITNIDKTQQLGVVGGATYGILDTLIEDDKHILVQRSVETTNLYKMNVYTGDVDLIQTVPINGGQLLLDSKKKIRYAVGSNEDGTKIKVVRNDGGSWTKLSERSFDNNASRDPVGLDKDDTNLIMQVSEKGEPAKTVLYDPVSGKETLLSSNKNVDPDGFILDEKGEELIAVAYSDGKPGYDFVNPDHPLTGKLQSLIAAFPNKNVRIGNQSIDGKKIVIRVSSDLDPGTYYLFDLEKNSATYLLANRPWIKPEQMSEMRPISVKARDGMILHGYLTIPNGGGVNLPLIVNPHGGPHGPRDSWGFNPEVQYFASRGYAVLQINFRGSGGYGKDYETKGYRLWGTTMQDDITDAVRWTISERIVDKDRICIYGASFGGYSALMSPIREQGLYKCTVGYVGVYNLPEMYRYDSENSEVLKRYFARVFPVSQADKESMSPSFNAEKIKIPVMIAHGGKDPRVPMNQYKFIKQSLEKASNPIEISVVEEKEGHGFDDFQNTVELYTKMTTFFDKYIGNKSVAGK
jgi:dipeptidyl aminopeptidase/acylaminoacyl peptidase